MTVTGQRLASDWPETDQRLTSDWPVTDQWLTSDWPVTGQWLTRDWPVTDERLTRDWPEKIGQNDHILTSNRPDWRGGTTIDWPARLTRELHWPVQSLASSLPLAQMWHFCPRMPSLHTQWPVICSQSSRTEPWRSQPHAATTPRGRTAQQQAGCR